MRAVQCHLHAINTCRTDSSGGRHEFLGPRPLSHRLHTKSGVAYFRKV
jgi:hypothetical protein